MRKKNVDIDKIVNKLGPESSVVVKEILIGQKNYIEAKVIYIKGLVDLTSIDETILKPLMLYVDEGKLPKLKVLEFICQKYIVRGDTLVTDDVELAINQLNNGRTLICLGGIEEFILVNTRGGEHRSITEAPNESAVRGTREAFVENLEMNLTMIKRIVKDRNLKIEHIVVGERSKTSACLVYIEDIVDDDLLNTLRERLKNISVDIVEATGIMEQFVEEDTYSPFPQAFGTERPDRVASKIFEGRVAVILSGTPFVLTYPALLTEFFQSTEDYYQRTLVSNFVNILKFISVILVIFLSPVYLALISYNVELIPINFIIPIAQSRQGIPLPPFIEILFMEIVIEFLREGGLRLPPKIASTISIVGGIIIGNAAIESKVVSPSTLLVIGVSTVASFIVPDYQMAISLRVIKFFMLILADALGFLGIAIGCYFLLFHAFSLKSMGVPYLTFSKQDMQDTFIRYPLYSHNKRPDGIPNKNPIRQGKVNKDRSEGDE
ncbi:MAG: spore germination protein [Clostridiales bacterium]|jgi:hypothetical protein|nr:spore germination protein [Clostridiales bacterium]